MQAPRWNKLADEDSKGVDSIAIAIKNAAKDGSKIGDPPEQAEGINRMGLFA